MHNNHPNRRQFLGTAALTIAGVPFGLLGGAITPPGAERTKASPPGGPAVAPRKDLETHGTPGPVKQINAGPLNVGYVDLGPAPGPVVLLLHGWPYDIHSYADVAPLLAAKGYRVIIPYVRGCGSTQFLSGETFRNGQPAARCV